MQIAKRKLILLAAPAPAPALVCVAMTADAGRGKCWMTGGGSVFRSDGVEVVWKGDRVTHGFELQCEGRPNNLQINWDGNHFHLQALTSAVCTDSPLIEPNPPDAAFDTYTGTGTGRYNGDAGARAQWVFTDAGEGGSGDTATITVWDANDNVVLEVSGFLTFGNHQAHTN